ncbi:MAG TPA: amidohydrolase family protein, partial [bacterium]
GMVPAVARYTECKCLTAGVTTSQGIRLYSDARAPGYYKGIVRNVEQTHQTDLPGADTRVADMDARELESFYRRLLASTCFLLHLCEGVGDTTRSKFTLLQFPDGKWAIERQLAGIHCVGLADRDFDVMAAEKGAMVWSPLSNLLLYGETARFRKALESGVRLGLGSDWSPSGSKNLLGELKVVQALCRSLTGMNDRDIVRMATLGAAEILAWNGVIGSLESGKRADLMVIDGTPKDSYGALIRAKETDVRLVMINGVRRYGVPSLMRQAGRPLERILVGGEARDLFLKQAVQDPKVAALSLGEAERQLRTALRQLPNLAAKLEKGPSKPKTKSRFGSFDPNSPPVWHLALDEIEDTGVDVRLRLPAGLTGEVPPSMRVSRAPKKPLSQLLKPLTLDPLTVADDDEYLDRLDRQMNLPDDVKSALKEAYG